MKTALFISIAAFTAACGGSHTDTSANPAGSSGANASAVPASQSSSSTVTLVGCLQGPRSSNVTGTAGPFVLANAAAESGGVGANGAGSRGSVASAGRSFELDGVPADARASVNKLVRVTGRLGARSAVTPGAPGGTVAAATTAETSTKDDVRANSTGVAGDSTSHPLAVETVQVVAQQCGPQ